MGEVSAAFPIGIGENDIRRLAAELERDTLQALRGEFHDPPADLRRTGKGNLSDQGMGDESVADGRAGSREHLQTPGGNPAAWASSPSLRAVKGDRDAGLSTTQLPAANAGAAFQQPIGNGKFQGTMQATTPIGCRR